MVNYGLKDKVAIITGANNPWGIGSTTAIYEYQADYDGEWGEISVDFENGTAEIIRLADWDKMKTNRFANKAIAYLLNCENEKLPMETMVAFEP